ncbi:MAG: hypothetical protein A2X86_13720 [Bdellovibrionales bacterium GWA2_49_15]|nr:MAG: hypothetical protein A2X86_13720 [Bdellovibrionales bacterium GWA2_49_15]HAZ13585.1 hypothetical protein [Bdellovibrionales bacterium]
MKIFTPLFLAFLFGFSPLSPEIETTEVTNGHYLGKGQQSYSLSAEQLVAMITDYPNSCQYSHCRYHVPNVEETRVFAGPGAQQFYLWTKIKNIKSGSYFSQVTIEENGEEVTIKNSMVSPAVALELSRKYGLPHEPIMDTTDSLWTLTEKPGETLVEIKIETSSNSGLINRFPKKVLSGLRESIEALLSNLMAQ